MFPGPGHLTSHKNCANHVTKLRKSRDKTTDSTMVPQIAARDDKMELTGR